MKQRIRRKIALLIAMVMTICAVTVTNATTSEAANKTPHVKYSVFFDKTKWTPWGSDATVVGKKGQSVPVTAFRIKLSNTPYTGGVKYRAYVQGKGWQSWVQDGEITGIKNKNLRAEAIQIKLYGNMSKYYDIKYRVYVQKTGWQSWRSNGTGAGTKGKKLRIEAIQIKLVKKATVTPKPPATTTENTTETTTESTTEAVTENTTETTTESSTESTTEVVTETTTEETTENTTESTTESTTETTTESTTESTTENTTEATTEESTTEESSDPVDITFEGTDTIQIKYAPVYKREYKTVQEEAFYQFKQFRMWTRTGDEANVVIEECRDMNEVALIFVGNYGGYWIDDPDRPAEYIPSAKGWTSYELDKEEQTKIITLHYTATTFASTGQTVKVYDNNLDLGKYVQTEQESWLPSNDSTTEYKGGAVTYEIID